MKEKQVWHGRDRVFHEQDNKGEEVLNSGPRGLFYM